jgi:hypothetical protein
VASRPAVGQALRLRTRSSISRSLVPPLALIHRTVWKVDATHFAMTEFYEVRRATEGLRHAGSVQSLGAWGLVVPLLLSLPECPQFPATAAAAGIVVSQESATIMSSPVS